MNFGEKARYAAPELGAMPEIDGPAEMKFQAEAVGIHRTRISGLVMARRTKIQETSRAGRPENDVAHVQRGAESCEGEAAFAECCDGNNRLGGE